MKNFYLTLTILCTLSLSTKAQFDQPSVGAGYSNATYYTIGTGEQSSHEHGSWDIAFSTGQFSLGVFVNEGVGLSFTGALPLNELYLPASTDFDNIDTTGMERIYNDEVSWDEGAFNHVKDSNNPADYGWGDYDFTTHVVNGTRVFVIKLRNGEYKKLQIVSMTGGVYNFKYANLDGSNLVEDSVAKADFAGKTLAYYSIENGTDVDLEPSSWDLLFTRYTTPLDAGGGALIQYNVTGTLSNSGVEVVQADDVDPSSVDEADYADQYGTELDIIGYDWKSYTGAWTIEQNRVYFVKNDSEIWMIQFIDFEGSSTGVTTIEKTLIGEVVNTEDNLLNSTELTLYPNPAIDQVNLAIDLPTAIQNASISIYNALGQQVDQFQTSFPQGFSVKNIPMNYRQGAYKMNIQLGGQNITKTVILN